MQQTVSQGDYNLNVFPGGREECLQTPLGREGPPFLLIRCPPVETNCPSVKKVNETPEILNSSIQCKLTCEFFH